MNGERQLPQHIIPTTKYAVHSAMVWGCFTAERVGLLVVVDSILNQDRYINILSQHLYSSIQESMPNGYIFQEGDASCHILSYVQLWKQITGIDIFDI
jgi:hypothetical protein